MGKTTATRTLTENQVRELDEAQALSEQAMDREFESMQSEVWPEITDDLWMEGYDPELAVAIQDSRQARLRLEWWARDGGGC